MGFCFVFACVYTALADVPTSQGQRFHIRGERWLQPAVSLASAGIMIQKIQPKSIKQTEPISDWIGISHSLTQTKIKKWQIVLDKNSASGKLVTAREYGAIGMWSNLLFLPAHFGESMTTRIKYLIVRFNDLTFNASELVKLRGFFAARFPHDHLFHNHLPGGAYSFAFPRIQYRLLDGSPSLLGIGEGIDLLKKVFLEIDELNINNQSITVNDRQIALFEEELGQCEQMQQYHFMSPWMALNQENDRQYFKLGESGRQQKLLNILKGNLLTLSKGMGYTIPDFDNIQTDGNFRPVTVNFHNIPMHCFYGDFAINFMIPPLWGLGKQSARGFGVVQRKEKR